MSEDFNPYEAAEDRAATVNAANASAATSYGICLLSVMGTAEGRRVLFHILHDIANMNATSFQGENPLTASFIAGKRDVALALFNEMRSTDFGLFHLMELEARERARAQEARKRAGAQEGSE